MKKCPQCDTVYGDEVMFCLNDGTALVEDSFSIPSEEEHNTIIRHDPIVIDFPAHGETEPMAHYPAGVPAENIVVVSAPPAVATRNYVLFLVLGLLIGGGLVLATLLFSKSFYQSEDKITINTNANANEIFKVEKPVLPSDTPENKVVSIEPSSNKHAEPNDSFEGIANGRVIVTNARIRSAPDKDASIVDTLPMNDRLDIIRRENSNSPWFQIECEHGTAGWMHGDTIEFTR